MKEQVSSLTDDRAAAQSELQQTRQELSELQEKVAELHNLLAEIDRAHAAERSLLVERASQAEQRALVVEQLIRGSTSWRLTAPLRGLKWGAGSVAAWPRTAARYGLQHAILWLRCRPRASALAKSLVRFVPPLERRFQAFARAYSASSGDVDAWTLEPDREILNEWRKLFRLPRS
jgi:O-antigen chain-terminating methyltransferase